MVRKLPETSTRINIVELKWSVTPFCLVNVYLPACGEAENEIQFEECLDMLHEIFTKYCPTHTIICGGDFNASHHRVDYLRRDELFLNFLKEHGMMPGSGYPVKDTFFHTANDSSSQIDYVLVGPQKQCLVILCRSPVHYLNLSDHTHIVLHLDVIGVKQQGSSTGRSSQADVAVHPRIRWNKLTWTFTSLPSVQG